MTKSIRDILSYALEKTFVDLPAEVERMPLKLWDESVFRYFLARNVLDQDRSLHIEREWRKVDLAIASGTEITLVEIKFWQLGNLSETTSHALTYAKKGGPGPQNFREYEAVIDKLKKHLTEQALGCIVGAFVVLVYADPIAAKIGRAHV